MVSALVKENWLVMCSHSVIWNKNYDKVKEAESKLSQILLFRSEKSLPSTLVLEYIATLTVARITSTNSGAYKILIIS